MPQIWGRFSRKLQSLVGRKINDYHYMDLFLFSPHHFASGGKDKKYFGPKNSFLFFCKKNNVFLPEDWFCVGHLICLLPNT